MDPGQLFGVGGPWFIALGLLAAAMGLHLMGWLPLRMPGGLNRQPKVAGMLGALLLGAVFGIGLPFVYTLGHCVLMLASGAFTGPTYAAW